MPVRDRYVSFPVFGVTLCSLLLAACDKPAPNANQAATAANSGQPVTAPPIAALQLATGAPPPLAPAPPAAALPPPTRAIRYARRPRADRYRYLERAYAAGDAYNGTPPDYTVDYQGTRPWIWRAHDGAYRVVERLPEGERDYYYDPGADAPYLVRDPDYAYAYDNGELAGVYGPDGRALDDVRAEQRAEEAARYLDRARALYRAAQYEQRQAAYVADWSGARRSTPTSAAGTKRASRTPIGRRGMTRTRRMNGDTGRPNATSASRMLARSARGSRW